MQARTSYKKFLMVAPDSPYVDEVKALIVELDKLVAASEAAAPQEATSNGAGQTGAASLSPPPLGEHAVPSAAASAQASANHLVEAPELPPEPARTGTRWWLWGSIGAAVVVGAAVTAYALRSPGTTTLREGSLGTLRR